MNKFSYLVRWFGWMHGIQEHQQRSLQRGHVRHDRGDRMNQLGLLDLPFRF